MVNSVHFSVEVGSVGIYMMVRGYHAYEKCMATVFGEELLLQKEWANSKDPFAVSMTKSNWSMSTIHHSSPVACLRPWHMINGFCGKKFFLSQKL